MPQSPVSERPGSQVAGSRSRVPRLLAPRWLALHALVLAALATCALLGWWQLDRAREQHAQSLRPAANALVTAVPLDTLLRPEERLHPDAVGRPVLVTGEYDPDEQVLVPGRRLDGVTGFAVVTPLVRDGAAVVVVRGWVAATPDGEAPTVPPPPAGTVTVTGSLAGSDEAPPLTESLPAGQLGSVHLASLVNLLPYPVYDAVVSRTSEDPPPRDALAALVPAPPESEGDWPVQNLFYALEWWIFGLAAVAMWVSAVRRRDVAAAPATTPARPDSA